MIRKRKYGRYPYNKNSTSLIQTEVISHYFLQLAFNHNPLLKIWKIAKHGPKHGFHGV
jgi:hypothetical protein